MFNQLEDVNLEHLLRTRRYFVMAVALAVVSVALLVFGIAPLAQQSWQLRSDGQKAKQKLAQLQTKVRCLEEAQTQQIVTQADNIDLLLPSKKPLLELMTGLNSEAENTGVVFTNVQLNPGSISTDSAQARSTSSNTRRSSTATSQKNNSGTDGLTVEVSVRGSLSQVNQFLARAEQLAPITNVTAITLNEVRDRNNTTGTTFEAEVQLTTYYFTRSIAVTVDEPCPDLKADQVEFLSELDSFVYTDPLQADEIRGGGLDDLFGVETLEIITQ